MLEIFHFMCNKSKVYECFPFHFSFVTNVKNWHMYEMMCKIQDESSILDLIHDNCVLKGTLSTVHQ